MGLFRRTAVVAGGTVAIGFTAVIYAEVGQKLITRLNNQNGPFSVVAGQIDTIIPIILVGLLLGLLVWLVVGGVQREKVVTRRPRR